MDRPSPAEYQPRLRLWSHGWRVLAILRVFDKLQVTNRVQIAICVHDAGLA